MCVDRSDRLLSEQIRNCQFIPFPVVRRIGKIRDVAAKMLQKRSARHAAYYREQVTEALVGQLKKIHLPKDEQGELVEEFWLEVEREVFRQSGGRSSGPDGVA